LATFLFDFTKMHTPSVFHSDLRQRYFLSGAGNGLRFPAIRWAWPAQPQWRREMVPPIWDLLRPSLLRRSNKSNMGTSCGHSAFTTAYQSPSPGCHNRPRPRAPYTPPPTGRGRKEFVHVRAVNHWCNAMMPCAGKPHALLGVMLETYHQGKGCLDTPVVKDPAHTGAEHRECTPYPTPVWIRFQLPCCV